MTRCVAVLTFAALLAAAACAGSSAEIAAAFGGAANYAAVETPDKVTAYRITRSGVLQHARAPDEIGGHEILRGPIDVDPASAEELAAIFADGTTYDFERAKGCDFNPGVAFRFAKAATVVDVLFCFECDEFAAYEGTKRVGGEDFDRSRPRLLALVKRLFPGDEPLQALK